MEIKGSGFYSTPEGAINAQIIGKNSARLNDRIIKKYEISGAGLIMGYGDGMLAEFFKDKFSELTIIEGSKKIFKKIVQKYKKDRNIKCFNSFFESFKLERSNKVDLILGNHVLEHVDDPIKVLEVSKTWLKDNGYAIFSVPNAKSLHRRIGVKMNMIDTIYDLNDQDRLVGHQRVYDKDLLTKDIKAAGYKIAEIGGFNLKLVSQKQMKDWSPGLIDAIFEISQDCPPDICSNLYVVCKN